MRSAGRFLVIISLCFAIGLHWFALQSIAWTTMLVDYARNYSLEEALAKTFDGQHPCSLCHAVQAGTKSEQKSSPRIITKVDFCYVAQVSAVPRKFLPFHYPTEKINVIGRTDPPLTPPPRLRA